MASRIGINLMRFVDPDYSKNEFSTGRLGWKIFVLCWLIGFEGCAGYQSVNYQAAGSVGQETLFQDFIAFKSTIRVTLKDGSRHIGTVASFSLESMELQATPNYGGRIIVIPIPNINIIEIQDNPKQQGMMVFATVLSVVLIGIEIGWIDFSIGDN